MKLEKILAIATFIMIVTVAVWAALRPDLIPRFNLVLLAGLIAVTTVYAYSTIKIARHSEKQAEEMRAQRLSVKPVVIPDIDIHFGQKDFTEKTEDLLQGDFPLVLTNVGTAAAIELELLLITPSNVILPSKLPLLLPGASWRRKLPFVSDFTDEGEPIFTTPPEGTYNLRVKFKSVTHNQDKQVSEVSLSFDLRLPRKNIGLSIIRGNLLQKREGVNQND